MKVVFLFLTVISVFPFKHITNAQDTAVAVDLRIEGEENTMLEASILSKTKTVTTLFGETYKCDGTNNKAHTIPGPTAISTLDLAATNANFTWEGVFHELYDDFSITRIGNISQKKSQYWNILVNYNFIKVGGCQQKVKQGDNVLFAFDAFNKKHILKLETSRYMSRIGSPVIVKVTDALTNQPIKGALVGNQITNADGFAVLVFNGLGMQKLKAEHSDSIRSNTIEINIAP